MITVVAKKTTELSDSEIQKIYDLFEIVFNKRRNTKSFHEQFENTFRGYSYHAIAIDDEKIVGHNVYMPFEYLHNETPFMLCLSIDAMVHPDYRNKGIYRKLLEACEGLAIKEGCKLRVGFPNDNSYPVQIKGFKYNDIGRLNTYMLPVNIGALLGKVKILNYLSKGLANCMCAVSRLSKSRKEYLYPYRKNRNTFDSYRYKWFGNTYQIKNIGDVTVVYKDAEFKGKKATFIIDVYPLSKTNFDLAVRNVYADKNKSTPLILYVGNLPFIPLSMIRIPTIFEPKHFHFVSKILDDEDSWLDSLELENWELNLSNFDLI